MADKLIVPRQNAQDDPEASKWGLVIHCIPSVNVGTSISEGSDGPQFGNGCGLELSIAEDFADRYTFELTVPIFTTEGKLTPSTFAEGTTIANSHVGLMAGFGRARSKLEFTDDGEVIARIETASIPLIGRGWTTVEPKDRELDGETFSYEGEPNEMWDLANRTSILVEFRPWGDLPVLRIGPSFEYGVSYENGDSDFNRIKLSAGLMLEIGKGTTSSEDGPTYQELGALGIAQAVFARFHGLLMRGMMNDTLADQQEALDALDIIDSGGDKGSLEDLPTLEATAEMAGGLSNSVDVPLSAGTGWFWGLTAAQAIGGAVFMAMDGSAGKTGGLADILGSLRLTGLAIAGIETPRKRQDLDDRDITEVPKREAIVNASSFAFDMVVSLIGAAADSDIAMKAGTGANLSVAMSISSVENSDVETSIAYVPTSTSATGDGFARGGILVHKSLAGILSGKFRLYTEARMISPALTPANAGAGTPTDVDAVMGFEWRARWARLSAGISTKAVYGGGDEAQAGIGAVAGFDLTAPLSDDIYLEAGIRASAHALLPSGDALVELAPHFGFGGCF